MVRFGFRLAAVVCPEHPAPDVQAVPELEEQIARLKESGLTVLLAEQNLEVALRLSDRGYVIDNGAIQYHGTREDLSCNEAVRDKYLGV